MSTIPLGREKDTKEPVAIETCCFQTNWAFRLNSSLILQLSCRSYYKREKAEQVLENPRGATLWRWPRKQQDRVSHVSAFHHHLRTATAGNFRKTWREFYHCVLLTGGGSVQKCLGYGISHIVGCNRAHCCIEPPICLAHVHFLCDFHCLSYQSKGHGLM